MDGTSHITMEQQQRQILDVYYPGRHSEYCVYPSSFRSSRSQTPRGEEAEHRVYDMLCTLNEPMFTMHSKRFCVFRAGEIDFLIFSKTRGIIILEVKSGTRSRDYRCAEEQLEKGATAVKAKVRMIKTRSGQSVSVRYAVVMPNVSRAGATHVEGCYQEDLGSREAFENWLNEYMPVLEDDRKLDNDKYDKCLARFLAIITDYDFYSVHSHLMSLTPEQAEMLEGLNEEAYITGPAGSGKTACMVIKASSEELRDQRKLVVVFNKPLRDQLGKNDFLGVQNIHVTTFGQLLQDIIGARMRKAVCDNKKNQSNRVNTAIRIALDPRYELIRFDSIFVDEAQDLYGNWELLFDVLHIKGEKHYKWIFYDNNQKVRYSNPPTQNSQRQEYHLTKVIRNTIRIFEASKPFYTSNRTVRIAHKIVGTNVEEMSFTDQDIEDINPEVVQIILISIRNLSICFGAVRPGDICILLESEPRAENARDLIHQQSNGQVVPFGLDQMIEYMAQPQQWPRDQIGDNRGNIGVTVDSVSRFKGLESKAVILVMGARNTHNLIEKMYVGTTRAICHLTVLYAES